MSDSTGDDMEIFGPDGSGADAPGAGMPDLGGLLGQAQKMQQQMIEAQAAAAAALIEGQAGGGVVRIEATGGLEFRSVTIDPTAVDPETLDSLTVQETIKDGMTIYERSDERVVGIRPTRDGLDAFGAFLHGPAGATDDVHASALHLLQEALTEPALR